eukprot:CAMPEP_0184990070 /NCGR_PEP_ID=MMETSP1098-20130426/30835_1 /TAXON_ID=89044 /ORGANISM="Spumella elongata, Strain CCAP 955/1" /LENGTH=63 /DNA_ID=CAMNT_0027515203 /DNA_START=33 /DNA_END=221 /DNA_ORIENTATION=-
MRCVQLTELAACRPSETSVSESFAFSEVLPLVPVGGVSCCVVPVEVLVVVSSSMSFNSSSSNP